MSNNKKMRYAREAILSESTPFAVAEAYKTLRTNLSCLAATNKPTDAPANAIVVSSALPGEGKSTVAADLAIAFAQSSSRVLLVDANMRKSIQHKYFGVKNDAGLSSCLGDLAWLAESIHHGVRPGLDLLTAGAESPRACELLGSANMKKLIDIACRVYDYVIIDTPPINIVSDVAAFAGHTSGVLMVTRSNYCGYSDLRRALGSLELASVRVLGIALTDLHNGSISIRRSGGYGAYKSCDNYGYGYSKLHAEKKSGASGTKGERT